ncbi:MAG: hypothetical protein Q4G33_15175, partial [bacterium]|nr:hypothetical protein [bacterium]
IIIKDEICDALKLWIVINYYIHKGKIHGLSEHLEDILNDSSKLVIVPDAGTGDSEECKRLIEAGKSVIILDHHSVESNGNEAIIVNNQLSEKITDKALTGVGVTYKFCKVLDDYYKTNYADRFLDLVAFGLIGDSADMTSLQTRYYTMKGIEMLQNRTGYNELLAFLTKKTIYSMNNRVSIIGIAFYINPLINSMIRLGEYNDKVIMFEAMCNSSRRIERKVRGQGVVEMSLQEYIWRACTSTNKKQKTMTDKTAMFLSEEIEQYKLDKYPIIVCNAGDDVEANSIGLIANKLASMYQRPCLLMKKYGDVCSGSGRGYNKCEIRDFRSWCEKTGLFIKTQGHPGAFGVSIAYDMTNELFELLSRMKPISEITYYVSGVYKASALSSQLVKNVAKYDYIWGGGVDEPLFIVKNLVINKHGIKLLGQKKNAIVFNYHDINFVKFTRVASLQELYSQIINCGDNIEFTVVGKFCFDYKTHSIPTVIVEDMSFRKSEKRRNVFGV